MDQFPVLPGDLVVINVSEKNEFFCCKVIEVGTKIPKQHGSKKHDSLIWKEINRDDFVVFCSQLHDNDISKYEKNTWAVLSIKINSIKTIIKRLRAIDIIDLIKTGQLVVTPKEKLK